LWGNDTMPRRKVTPEVLEKMKRLRAEGMSYEKIARRLGLHPMTVYNHLQKKERTGLIGKLKEKVGLR
jgi:DNA invertase Pin-like site-specific DNA recombinase